MADQYSNNNTTTSTPTTTSSTSSVSSTSTSGTTRRSTSSTNTSSSFTFTVDLKFSVKTNFLYGTTQEYERYVNYQDWNEQPLCYTDYPANPAPEYTNQADCEAQNNTWHVDPELERLDIYHASYYSNGSRLLNAPGYDKDPIMGGGVDEVTEMKTITFTVGSEDPIESGYFLDGSPWVRNNAAGVFLVKVDPEPEEKLNAYYESFMVNETVINPDSGKVLGCQVGQTSILPGTLRNFNLEVDTRHWDNSTKYHKTCIPYKAWIIDGQPTDHGMGYEYLTASEYNVSPVDGPAFDRVMNESEWITAWQVNTDGDGRASNGYYLGWDGRGSITSKCHNSPGRKPPSSDQEAEAQLSNIGWQALNSFDGEKDKNWIYNWAAGYGWNRGDRIPRWNNQWKDRRNKKGDEASYEWWENGNQIIPPGEPGGDVDPEKPIPGLVEYVPDLENPGNNKMNTPNGIRYWGSVAPNASVQGSPNHSYYKAKERTGLFKDRAGTVRYSGVWDRESVQLQDHDFVSSAIGHYDEANVLYAREEMRRLYISNFLKRPEYCGPNNVDSVACTEGDERCNAACGDVWWLALSAATEGDPLGPYNPGTWNVHDTSGVPGSRNNPPLGGVFGLNPDVANNPLQWEPDESIISDEWNNSDTVLLSGQGQIDYFDAANDANENQSPRSYCVGCMTCNKAQCDAQGFIWREDVDGYDYKDFVQYYDPTGELDNPDNIVPISWSGWSTDTSSKFGAEVRGWGIDGENRRSVIDMYGALVCVPYNGINYNERFRPPFNWDPTERYIAPYIEERSELEDFNFGGPVLSPPADLTECQLYYPEYGMDNEIWPRQTPVDNNFNETCDCTEYIDYDWEENPDNISAVCKARCTLGSVWRLSDFFVETAWDIDNNIQNFQLPRLGTIRPIFDPSERDDSVQGFNNSTSITTGEYAAIEVGLLHGMAPISFDKNMDYDPAITKLAAFDAETEHRLTDVSLFDGSAYRKKIRRTFTQRGIDVWGAMRSMGKFTSPNGGHSEPYDWYILFALMCTGYQSIFDHFNGEVGSKSNGTYKSTDHNSARQKLTGYGTFCTNLGDMGNVGGQSYDINNSSFMASAGPNQFNRNGGGFFHNCRIPDLKVTKVEQFDLSDTGYGEGAQVAGIPEDTLDGVPQGTWTYDPSLQPGANPKRYYDLDADGERVEIVPEGNTKFTRIALSVPEPATAGGTYGIGSFAVNGDNAGEWVWQTEDAEGNAIAPPSGIRGLMQEVAIESAIRYDELYFDLIDVQGKNAEEAEEILSTYQFYRPQLPEYFFVDGTFGGRDKIKSNPDRMSHSRLSFINGFDVRQSKTVLANGNCTATSVPVGANSNVPWLTRGSSSVSNNGHWVLVNNVGSIGNNKFIGFSIKNHRTCNVHRIVNDTYRANDRPDIPLSAVECGGKNEANGEWSINMEIELILQDESDIVVGDIIDLQPATANEVDQRVAHFNCVNYATTAGGLGGAGNYDFTFRRGSLMMSIASRLMNWPETKIDVDGSYSQSQIRETFPPYWHKVYDKIVAFWTHPTLRFKSSTCRVIGCTYELFLPTNNAPLNNKLPKTSNSGAVNPYYIDENEAGYNTVYRALVKQQLLDPIGKLSYPHYDSTADMIYYWSSTAGHEMVPIAETPKNVTAMTTDDPGRGTPRACMFDSLDGYQVSSLDENGNPILDTNPNSQFPPNNVSGGVAMTGCAVRQMPSASNLPTTITSLSSYLPVGDDQDDSGKTAYLGSDTVGLIDGIWEDYEGYDAIYVRSGTELDRLLSGDFGSMHYDYVSQNPKTGKKKSLYMWVNGTNNPVRLVLIGERFGSGNDIDGEERDPNYNWSQTWALPKDYKYLPESLSMWVPGFPSAFFFAEDD